MINIAFIVRELVLFLLIALSVILVTRHLAIPYTLGLVVVGLLMSLAGILPEAQLTPDLVLFVFLPALLFEGAWTIKLGQLRANWRPILFLAGPGLLLSLILIATVLHLLDGLDWGTALLLGAILSPTDPVSVIGLFRQMKVDERLSTIIEGESLFNDGIAGSLYQTFLAVVLLSLHGQSSTDLQGWVNGLLQFVLQAGGGIVCGVVLGIAASYIVRSLYEPLIETTITIVTAYGAYLLADTLHLSAILAVIAAGLLLGSYGRRFGMSEHTRESVDNFWAVLAFIANALLFLLVGVQLNPTKFFSSPASGLTTLLTALFAVIVVLLARFLLVLVFMLYFSAMPSVEAIPRSWRLVIFWSGLRGALSLALVLAIPLEVPSREMLLVSTYAVVFFTLLVQGLSLRGILSRLSPKTT